MNTNPAVVYDACVLYPAPLRDLLVELAGLAQDLDWFRAKWTEEIHDEWIRNLLENRPDLTRQQVNRTKDLMNRHIDDCLVTGYEHRIKSLNLPDENDRHVLAAAIECGASIIVTANLGDFPAETLVTSGIQPMTADDFVCEFLDTYEESGEKVLEEAVRAIKRRLRNPAMSWNQYFECLESMEGNELTNTVRRLRAIIPAEEVSADDLLFKTETATEGEWLTTQEAAEMIACSHEHVIDLINEGQLKCREVGSHRQIKRDELLRFIEEEDKERDAAMASLIEHTEETGGYELK